MSGGIAWVWDRTGVLQDYTNPGMVELLPLEVADDEEVLMMARNHLRYTRSDRAAEVLANWATVRGQFVKVISPQYRRVLELQNERKELRDEELRRSGREDAALQYGEEVIHG